MYKEYINEKTEREKNTDFADFLKATEKYVKDHKTYYFWSAYKIKNKIIIEFRDKNYKIIKRYFEKTEPKIIRRIIKEYEQRKMDN